MPTKYNGLTNEEAQGLLTEYGPNSIRNINKVTPLQILYRQIKSNFMVYMLLVASVTSFMVGKTITGYTIIGVIVCVVFVGFIQEYKADGAVEELKKMLMPISIVIRDGHKVEIPSEQIVPGDILVLGNGEKIPADCTIIESLELRVNESALTGESKDINKKPIDDKNNVSEENSLYMGTFIVDGKCYARVTHTGMNTKFGKIAHLISSSEKELLLQEKVNKIAKTMVIVALTFSTLTGLLFVLISPEVNGEVLVEALILMIAISVSAFPEGFPVVLITTLALGAKRMASKNVIVNRMSIIETLGETTIICTDKTGTITRGEMMVKFIYDGHALYEVGGTGYVAHGDITKNNRKIDVKNSESLNLLIDSGIICNDAEIERTGNDNEYRGLGSPTETALLVLGAKSGKFIEDYQGEIVGEYPFNSDRKMMSVLYETKDKEYVVYAKGAPEVLFEKCTKIFRHGKEHDLEEKHVKDFKDMQEEMARHSYRTLALAYKNVDHLDRDYTEEKFTFLGLVAMEDAPREEVKQALEITKEAGIGVKMITGDNPETAKAIAKQIGLQTNVLSGVEIDNLSDSELSIKIKDTQVFARVTPEHKLRIVRLLKDQGETVAMTGDGVNDAPALKEAHIGIAMGKNGTDVSRSSADLTLKDDNFANIVDAITEGRTIYNNIRKFVAYQLSVNVAELIILLIGVALSPVFGWHIPILLSIQILFMNLVTDNIPALTLGVNPTSKDIMKEQPRDNSLLVNKGIYALIGFSGIIMALLSLLSHFISYNILGDTFEVARTTLLLSLIIMEIVAAFSFRSFRKKILNRSPFVNMSLVYASLVSLFATVLVIYTPASKIFETVSVGYKAWLISISLGLLLAIIFDTGKIIFNKSDEFIRDTR